MILVPATMALLGKANWWLPAWLDRALPHLTLEGSADDGETGESGDHPPYADPSVVVSDEGELVGR
jgi:RND superfamily putative drug exporter